MRPAQVSILIICLSVGLVGYSTGQTSGPPTELKLENLLQQPLADEFAPATVKEKAPAERQLDWATSKESQERAAR